MAGELGDRRFPLLGLPVLYARVKWVPRISSKNQITLPVETLERAGLSRGDDVVIEAEGPDRIVVRRRPTNPREGLGVFDGLYAAGYLDDLRSSERA